MSKITIAAGTTVTGYKIPGNGTTLYFYGVANSTPLAAIYSPNNFATVVNGGTVNGFIDLESGGAVTNQSTGKISGGVVIAALAGTVSNAGTITGTDLSAAGIELNLDDVTGIVTNTGHISAVRGVEFDTPGTLTNSGVIIGTGTTISAGVLGGVDMADGGNVTNNATGTISGYYGVEFHALPGNVVNSGTISGSAVKTGYGIALSDAGSVTNNSGGTITGYEAVQIEGNAGTLVNAGSIGGLGTAKAAVYLRYSGGVTNQSGGTISGWQAIAVGTDDNLTLHNAGRIIGTGGTAVAFYASADNRVVLSPGGSFTGKVVGGAAIVLEMASGAATGTLANALSNYVNFTSFTVDANASWQLNGTNTLTAPLSVAGTLANAGSIAGTPSVSSGGKLSNAGHMSATGGEAVYVSGGSVTNLSGGVITAPTGVLGKNSAATITNSGSIGASTSTGNGIALRGGGTVSNATAANISGYDGIQFTGTAGVVVNSGGVVGSTGTSASAAAGIRLDAGGSVTNQSSGTVSGYYGVRIGTVAGTVVNFGSIYGSGSYAAAIALTHGGTVSNYGTIDGSADGTGVDLAGGTLTNHLGGHIDGAFGVSVTGAPGAIVNLAAIGFAATYIAVEMADGGSVSNASGATIAGTNGVGIGGMPGTVTNSGGIGAATSNYGVAFGAGGTVTNESSASIAGSYAITIDGGAGTVVNAGTLAGEVVLPAGYANRVIADPGAVFGGVVDGGNTVGGATSTFELASGSSAGTLSGFGSQYTDFTAITVDASAHWTLTGGNSVAAGTGLTNAGTLTLLGASLAGAASLTGSGSVTLASGSTLAVGGAVTQAIAMTGSNDVLALGSPAAFSGTLSGFAGHATIDLAGLHYVAGASATVSGSTLDVVSGGTTIALHATGLTNGRTFFTGPDSGAGTEVIACFAAGTRIATPTGESPIECLRIGDAVRNWAGVDRVVKWIGRRGYDAAMVAGNVQLRPVRISAHAIGPGVPRRDLLVSPSHALLVAGALIPAGALVNGASIVREPAGDIRYFHLELDGHDVVLAEGMPAETFFDCDSRFVFDNADEFSTLYPAAVTSGLAAPRLECGAVVDAVRRRLAALAGLVHVDREPGRLHGHVERITATAIEGWVLDDADPEAPVRLDISIDAATPVRVIANRYRGDLDRAGLAGGRCGFRHKLPRGAVRVRVCRAADGLVVPGPAA